MTKLWQEMTSEELEIAKDNDSVIIIPIASTEQHGLHLPTGTDTFLVYDIVKDTVEKLADRRTIYTLPVWTGYSAHHMDFNGTITIDLKLFINIINSICLSIYKHGFKRIVLLNGHGGNINVLKSICVELKSKYNLRPVTFSYWDIVADYIDKWKESEPRGMDHSGECETSLMMYKHDDLVRKNKFVSATPHIKSKFLGKDTILQGPVFVPYDVKEVTGSGVLGEPNASTRKKGKDLYIKIIDTLIEFLREFQNWDIDNPKNL